MLGFHKDMHRGMEDGRFALYENHYQIIEKTAQGGVVGKHVVKDPLPHSGHASGLSFALDSPNDRDSSACHDFGVWLSRIHWRWRAAAGGYEGEFAISIIRIKCSRSSAANRMNMKAD